MGLFVRTLLIWLLVVVVPAQGVAAATMAFCGPNHHARGLAPAEMGAGADQHLHQGDVLTGDVLEAEATADVGCGHDATAIDKTGHDAKQKCSACASCCALGAILATAPAVPVVESTPTVFITVVPTVDAFAATGPDRPPRNVLV